MNEVMKAEKGRNMKKGRESQGEIEYHRGRIRNPPVGGRETLEWLRALQLTTACSSVASSTLFWLRTAHTHRGK